MYEQIDLLSDNGHQIPDWKKYEIEACRIHNLILWDLLPKEKRAPFYRDMGIDGLSEDGTIALQAKYHGDKTRIKYEEISTFFTTASVLNVGQKILTCTNPLSKNKNVSPLIDRNLIEYDHYEVSFTDQENLEEEDYSRLKARIENLDETSEDEVFSVDLNIEDEITLRPYQEESAEGILSYIDNNTDQYSDPYRVKMATGLGKSIVMLEAVLGLLQKNYNKISIIVPLISISVQFEKYFLDFGFEDDLQVINTYTPKIEKNKKVYVVVYNSLANPEVREALADTDAVFYDEAHHSYKNKGDLFEGIPNILLSATLKGEVNQNYDIEFGIRNGYLCDYLLSIQVYEGNGYSALVQSIINHPEWLRVLGFCNTVHNLKIVSQILLEKGIKFGFITAKTKPSIRKEYISKLERLEIRVLLSIRTISEGVDIPSATTALFFDPPGIERNSKISAIQKIGRVLRTDPSKTKAFVVIGLNNQQRDREAEIVAKFLSLAEGLDENCETGDIFRSGRLNIEIVNEDGIEIHNSELNNFEIIREAVYENMVGSLELKWMENYEKVKEYVQKEGKLPSEKDKNKAVKSLGRWCRDQKIKHKERELSEERIQKLEQIDKWEWARDKDEKWIEKYEQVKEYVQKEGKLPSWRDREVKSLGRWCIDQRTKHNNPESGRGRLTEEQIEKLEQIEGWYWEQDLDGKWMEKYQQLKEYVQEEGKIPSTTDKNKEVRSLGYWCRDQRRKHKKFSDEKIEKLEQISKWHWGKDEQWMEKYEQVKEYVQKGGKLPSTTDKNKEVRSLGYWCRDQRRKHNPKSGRGRLTEEQIEKLEQIQKWKWER